MQKEKNHVSEIAPGGLLNQALKHTPAIKYAIAVAAIAGLIATSLRYGFSAATLVFGVIIVIGLMVLFFAFCTCRGKQARYRIGERCCSVVIPTAVYR